MRLLKLTGYIALFILCNPTVLFAGVSGPTDTGVPVPDLPIFRGEFTGAQIENLIENTPRATDPTNKYKFVGPFYTDSQDIFDGLGYYLSEIQKPEYSIYLPSSSIGRPFGTPFLERAAIKSLIFDQLNRSWIGGYGTGDQQALELYKNGLRLAKDLSLKLGRPLRNQINLPSLNNYYRTIPNGEYRYELANGRSYNRWFELPYDVIWVESEGGFLYPKLYLSEKTLETYNKNSSLNGSGNILSFGSADLSYESVVINDAEIQSRRGLVINASNLFRNTNGKVIVNDNLSILAGKSIENYSGEVKANDIQLVTQKFENKTLVSRIDFEHGYSDYAENIATIESIGNLTINASGNVAVIGGALTSGGSLTIESGGNVQIVTQPVSHYSAQSGTFWSDNSSSTKVIQSALNAEDIAILANGAIQLEGAQLNSRGFIQLLAGMGIYITNSANSEAFDKSFETASGGIFGNEVSQSEQMQKTEIVRTVIEAGRDVQLTTKLGDIVLRGVDLNSDDLIQVEALNGNVQLLLAREQSFYSYEFHTEDLLLFSDKNRGYNNDRGFYNQITAQQGFLLNASQGVVVEYVDNGVDCGSNAMDDTCIAEIVNSLSASPEFGWLQSVYETNRAELTWQPVKDALDSWNYSNQGLTKAGAILVSITVGAVLGPGISELVAAAGPIASPVLTAGLTSMSVKASTSLLGNGFDISATLDELGSDDYVKSLVTSMVTAGVMAGLDNYVLNPPEGVAVDGLNVTNEAAGNLDSFNSFSDQALEMVGHATVNAGIPLLINGGGDSDDFFNAFGAALASDAVVRIGKHYANAIGDAKKNGQIETATQYIAHAALGCAYGAAQTAITSGNSAGVSDGCASGAGGAVVGEAVAQYVRNDFFDAAGELRKNKDVSLAELDALYQKYKAQGVVFAKLGAGLAALAFDGDISIATSTGENAAKNNCFFLAIIPVMIALDKAYTIYEYGSWSISLAEAIKAGDQAQIDALLEEQAKSLAIDAAMRALPMGNLLKALADKLSAVLPASGKSIITDLLRYADEVDSGGKLNMVSSKETKILTSVEPEASQYLSNATKITPTAHTLQSQKDVITDVANKGGAAKLTDLEKGTYGEIVTDSTLIDKGYTPLHEPRTALDQGHGLNGIDGIFEKNGKYYIVESKYGSASLDHSAGQMGKEWIQNHIDNTPDFSPELMNDILSNYVPVISKVDQYGNVVFKEILHDSAGAVIKSRAGYQPIIM
jgi:filamentous hemagglutinin